MLSVVLGGLLGLWAGIVGIGGGIFLASVLHSLQWHRPKTIAALCSIFIVCNSCAGIIGHSVKWHVPTLWQAIIPFAPLVICVAIAGFIGALWGARWLPEQRIKQLTACFMLWVAWRLAWAAYTLN